MKKKNTGEENRGHQGVALLSGGVMEGCSVEEIIGKNLTKRHYFLHHKKCDLSVKGRALFIYVSPTCLQVYSTQKMIVWWKEEYADECQTMG